MSKNCEDCHVLTERIKSLAHWIVEGEALSTLLPSDRQLVANEILKLVKLPPTIIGCDRCSIAAIAAIDDFDGWKIPDPEDFDDVTLCPKCQKETDHAERV